MNSQQRKNSASRLDFERLRATRTRLIPPGGEAMSDALPSFLGRVVSVETSLKTGEYVKVIPATVLGNETEGTSGTFTAQSGTCPTVLVYLLGSFVPMTGDYLVCRFVDHRWVAETTGGGISHGHGTVVIPACFCTLPPVLQMTSGDPACNYGMFQSCTLSYGSPPPAVVALGLNTDLYTSSALFLDPITNSEFFYHFFCHYNQFFLSRIFPVSPLGSPYRDGILYYWTVGGYGNSCDPLLLEVGMPFPGSDLSCSVSITAG